MKTVSRRFAARNKEKAAVGKADFYGLEGGTAGEQYFKSREPKDYRVDGQIQT